ncbi:MAG: biotin/lipoyl-binding protein [Candidatus Poseidonia sp.]|nr:biotin/lipoyl-binding protein [Poseidonia sp.]
MQHTFAGPDGEIEVELSKQGDEFSYQGHLARVHGERIHLTLPDGRTALAHVAKHGDVWWVHLNGHTFRWERLEPGSVSTANDGGLVAPMPGKVLEVFVKVGDTVAAGDALMVLEAMKMEHRIVAVHDGVVTAVHFGTNDQVVQGAALLEIEDSN